MKSFHQLTPVGQIRRLRTLVHQVLPRYGIRDYSLKILNHGENTTFCVLAQDEKYLFRVHRHGYNTPEQILSELLWLEALSNDTHLTVPKPIRTQDGNLIPIAESTLLQEPRVCSLLHWVEGRFYYKGLSKYQVKLLGQLMAHLHNHSEHWLLPEQFTRRHWNYSGLFDIWPEQVWNQLTPRRKEVFTEAQSRVQQTMAQLGFDKKHYGLIHADLHCRNFLFNRGSIIPIDFDDCGFGHWSMDLATTLDSFPKKNFQEFSEALLEGYEEYRELFRAEYDSLKNFRIARLVHVSLWWIERSFEHAGFRKRKSKVLREIVKDIEGLLD